jgi:hypothetical protein
VSRDLPEQKQQPLVSLRIVDQDKDPDLPVAERIDIEKTRWAHEVVTKGGKELPLIVTAAQQQMALVVPTPLEIAAVEEIMRSGLGLCGACTHCDYAGGQERLIRGAAWEAYERMRGRVENLPPWRNLGFCDAKGCYVAVNSLATFDDGKGSAPCADFRERLAKRFLRAVGGLIKRVGDI